MKVLFFCHKASSVEHLVVALRLRWPDLRPLIASQGEVALQVVEQESPDLVVITDDLVDLSITQAIREVREFSDVPMVVATESEDEVELVKALELGADEYIRMPCSLMEIMARVVTLMRRTGSLRERSESGHIQCGDLLINPATYEVFLGTDRILLTPTEFKLLYLLAKNRNNTVTQDFIQRSIWGDQLEMGQTVKKHIQRLRRKLGDDARNPLWIKTVHGVGYRFSPPVVATPTP